MPQTENKAGLSGQRLYIRGRQYRLRLDFRAMAEIEAELGLGFGEIILRRCGPGLLTVAELAILFRGMLRRGNGPGIGPDAATALMFEAGLEAVGAAVASEIAAVFGMPSGRPDAGVAGAA